MERLHAMFDSMAGGHSSAIKASGAEVSRAIVVECAVSPNIIVDHRIRRQILLAYPFAVLALDVNSTIGFINRMTACCQLPSVDGQHAIAARRQRQHLGVCSCCDQSQSFRSRAQPIRNTACWLETLMGEQYGPLDSLYGAHVVEQFCLSVFEQVQQALSHSSQGLTVALVQDALHMPVSFLPPRFS